MEVTIDQVLKCIATAGLPKKARDPVYLDHVRSHACIRCDQYGTESHHFPHKGMGGGGTWSDYCTTPWCMDCHRWWHEKATRTERDEWKPRIWKWTLESLELYFGAGDTATPSGSTDF